MPRRLIAAMLLALLAVVAFGGWALNEARSRAAVARGAALFRGEAPLAGRIVGHTVVLPATVARCVNCHETRSTAVSAAASAVASPAPGAEGAVAGRYGPALGRATLAQLRPRRGGPASRYDAAALCVLLRSGVDPAQVVIPQAMPRYDIDAVDCEALWAYLLTR